MEWRLRSMRRPAVNEPGHAHELTFCCFHRYPFLKSERACRWLAESLEEARQKLDFALWAYVFMPEHGASEYLRPGHLTGPTGPNYCPVLSSILCKNFVQATGFRWRAMPLVGKRVPFVFCANKPSVFSSLFAILICS